MNGCDPVFQLSGFACTFIFKASGSRHRQELTFSCSGVPKLGKSLSHSSVIHPPTPHLPVVLLSSLPGASPNVGHGGSFALAFPRLPRDKTQGVSDLLTVWGSGDGGNGPALKWKIRHLCGEILLQDPGGTFSLTTLPLALLAAPLPLPPASGPPPTSPPLLVHWPPTPRSHQLQSLSSPSQNSFRPAFAYPKSLSSALLNTLHPPQSLHP